MTAGRELTVALRLQSDMAQGIRDLEKVTVKLAEVGKAAVTANTAGGLDSVTKGARDAAQAVDAAKAAVDRLNKPSTPSKASTGGPTVAIGKEADAHAAAVEKISAANAVGAKSFDRFGVSAGQTKQAVRQLPAQLTDVATQLAGGQNPLLVLLQQGGQVKDSFGGIRPAAAALVGFLSPVAVAVGAVAAVAAVMGTALYQGAQQSSDLSNALAVTGNQAGITEGQFNRMVGQLASAKNVGAGAARELLQVLVTQGQTSSAAMESTGRAALALARLNGQSAADNAKSFAGMGDSVTAWATKANKTYSYLTAEQYKQIQALEAQGRTSEAVRLNMDALSATLESRTAPALGVLERALKSTATWFSNFWDAAQGAGRAETLEDRLAGLQTKLDGLRKPTTVGNFNKASPQSRTGQLQAQQNAPEISAAEQEAETIRRELARNAIRASDKAAAQAAENEKIFEASRQYQDTLAAIQASGASKLATDQQSALEAQGVAIERAYTRFEINGEQYRNRVIASERAKLAIEEALARNAIAIERNRVVSSKAETNSRVAAVIAAEARLSALAGKRAKLEGEIAAGGFTGKPREVVETRQANFRQAELANNGSGQVVKAAADQALAAFERIKEGLADVDAQLLRATGNNAAAAVAEIEKRYKKLRADLVNTGDTQGLIKIDKLVDIDKAKAQLADLQLQVDLVLGNQSRAEQLLQSQVATGAVAEFDAKRQVLDLHAKTANQIDALIPRMRELAKITGDKQLSAGVEDLQVKTTLLRAKADELKVAFEGAFKNSFESALIGLANGTKSLGEAARGFLLDLATGLAQFAAQQLAVQATAALMKTLTGGTDAAGAAGGGAASAIAAEAIALAGATAGTAISGGAVALDAAAVVTAGAGGSITTSAGFLAEAGAVVGAAAIAMSKAASEMAAAAVISAAGGVFATGGYTGPGHKYQPAGIVHAGEFVHRQEVVRQPNALAFLSDFNRQGMAALAHWSAAPGYASGGLVMPTGALPAMPAYQPADARSGATQLSVQQRLLPVLDDNLIADALRGPKGEELVVLHISRNPAKFRQILKV